MPSLTGVQTCALRSEEHTSELQSLTNIVCRLLLEKKKIKGRSTGNRVQLDQSSLRGPWPGAHASRVCLCQTFSADRTRIRIDHREKRRAFRPGTADGAGHVQMRDRIVSVV